MITCVGLVYFGCTFVSKIEKYITSVSWFATFPTVSCSGSFSEAKSMKLAGILMVKLFPCRAKRSFHFEGTHKPISSSSFPPALFSYYDFLEKF